MRDQIRPRISFRLPLLMSVLPKVGMKRVFTYYIRTSLSRTLFEKMVGRRAIKKAASIRSLATIG